MNLKKYLLIGSILFSNPAYTNSPYPLLFTKDESIKIFKSFVATNAIRTLAQLNPHYKDTGSINIRALTLDTLEAGAIILSNVLFSLPRESMEELDKLLNSSSTLTDVEKQKRYNNIQRKMFEEVCKNILCSTLGSIVGGVAPSANHLYNAYYKK